MAPFDSRLTVDGRTICVREVGDPDGKPVLYFHGTPTSRLDIDLADDIASEQSVRLVSFDRPACGKSDPAAFSLNSIARDSRGIADQLGIVIFATLGLSGGGPFALAAATLGDGRVVHVGVADGVAPYQLAPGSMDDLSDGDRAAAARLPEDPEGAAQRFGDGFARLREALLSDEGVGGAAVFGPYLSESDRMLMEDPVIGTHVIASMRESLRPGVEGAGWDNVSWLGHWDVDLSLVGCPVLLWYGQDDRFLPASHPGWLHDHLADSRLIIKPGEGHFGLFEHFAEILAIIAA
ncbi:MAG: alpha/beta hydrolase [Acidimicrobiales bacterium]